MKILVVEDNKVLNKTLVNMLHKENYKAVGAYEIEEAKEIFEKEKPDIVLLDIMLPDGKGYDLITYIRQFYDCIILMVTALNDEESKKICYEKGADDYITKPFELNDLVYKLRAISRRVNTYKKELQIGDLSFDLDCNRIKCKEKNYDIQPSQIKLLKMLYDQYNNGSYLHKEEIIEWMNQEMNVNSRIQTLMARLRKNLLDIGSEEIFIETLYGKGYQLIVSDRRKKVR